MVGSSRLGRKHRHFHTNTVLAPHCVPVVLIDPTEANRHYISQSRVLSITFIPKTYNPSSAAYPKELDHAVNGSDLVFG